MTFDQHVITSANHIFPSYTSASGGFFDGTTSSDHRRQFLLDLLKHEEGHEGCRSSGLPTSEAEAGSLHNTTDSDSRL